mmetsp:Transcript_42410/g.120298  ORF Transcript_42410/g.120298 Transcript_42410/m.120298 type:complete len:326 (-) Transcript_42410:274-1251(-)
MEERDASSSPLRSTNSPTVVLVIGMAGSGKTTFLHALSQHLSGEGRQRVYTINLDPAAVDVPYTANIDIRDTVKYKEVMKHYHLGPNGAILTSLNLFSTKFDQVLSLLETRAPNLDYVVIDTPGQIEAFNWSASGSIITETLALAFPTIVAYVVDTPRSNRPVTFMSNMLYACRYAARMRTPMGSCPLILVSVRQLSVLYKIRLPFVLCFNKIDVESHSFALDWMNNPEKYRDDLHHDITYLASLSRSMSLVLEEFYRNLRAVGVSAATGAGMQAFFEALAEAKNEYNTDFVEWIRRRREGIDMEERIRVHREMGAFETHLRECI